MILYRFALPLLGLWGCDAPCLGECGGVQANYLTLATVKDASGHTLVHVCSDFNASDSRSKLRFSAEPGSVVEEEVLNEGRLDYYESHDAPHRDTAYWCDSTALDPAWTRNLQTVNTCIVVTDDDPPAKILSIEPRGIISGKVSSGYTMKLEVLHSGVLHVRFDKACKAQALDQPAPDGGADYPSRPELEIL